MSYFAEVENDSSANDWKNFGLSEFLVVWGKIFHFINQKISDIKNKYLNINLISKWLCSILRGLGERCV